MREEDLTMPPLRIGRLARLANVNVQTLRFYERKGLLPKPTRRLSGYREFAYETIGIVRLIKYVQGLGFSLREIKEIITLRKMPSLTLAATCGTLESKIEEIDVKIAELTAIRGKLAQMLDHHRQRGGFSFAESFDRHVQQLVSEAMAGHGQEWHQKRQMAGQRGRKRKPKRVKTS
jgi:DNA-binding transcriptional MerR regulator